MSTPPSDGRRDRPGGRRIARPAPTAAPESPAPTPARSLLLVLAVVVVTVGALVVAGTSNRPHDLADAISRTATLSRDFSCGGGIKDARAHAGYAGTGVTGGITVDGAPATARAIKLSDTPARVLASTSQAAGAFAVRSATGHRWLAAGACPSPRAEWWFVGVGGSSTHDSVLELDNPRAGDALVDITLIGPDGAVEAPGLNDVRVDTGTAVRLDLKKYAPAIGDLAVHVRASRGLVTASAPEVWSSGFTAKKAHDWVTDQPRSARRATLVGLADPLEHATMLLGNPSSREAVVTLAFVGEQGTFAPTKHASVNVPPDTVLPVDLDDVLKAKPLAIRVRSQVRITSTVRSTRGIDETYAAAVSPVGRASVAGVPPGTTGHLVLVAGAVAGQVTVTGYDASGRQVGSHEVSVPAKGAARFQIWPRARSVRIAGTDGNDVAGVLLLGRRHARVVATIPLTPTYSDTHVPLVRPGW